MYDCLILDLDHTLINTVNSELDNLKMPDYIMFSGNEKQEVMQFNVYKRPHIEIFLDYVFKKYKYIIIWSAGNELYVKEIVKFILKDKYIPYLIMYKEIMGHEIYKNVLQLGYPFPDQILFLDDYPGFIQGLPTAQIIAAEQFYYCNLLDDYLKRLIEKRIV